MSARAWVLLFALFLAVCFALFLFMAKNAPHDPDDE